MTTQVVNTVEKGIVISPKQSALTEWDVLKGDKSLFNKRLSLMITNGNRLSEQEVGALGAYALTNDLNPFNGECYYLPTVGPVPGIAGWRRKAHEQLEYEAKEAKHREPVAIWTDVREATHAEAMFQDGDIAIHVTLHDSLSKSTWIMQMVKLANELKDLGVANAWEEAQSVIGPEPTWTGVGVVVKTETFARDGKPEKFDRIERATKRAEKLALRKRFQRLHLPEPEGNYDDAEFQFSIERPQTPQLNSGQSVENIIGDLYGPEAEAAAIAQRKEREIQRQAKEIVDAQQPKPEQEANEKPTPEADVRAYVKWLAEQCTLPTSEQSMKLAALLDTFWASRGSRYEFMSYLAEKPVKTSNEIPDLRVITALYEWLQPKYNDVAKHYYTENEQAKALITHAHAEYLKALGQETLF